MKKCKMIVVTKKCNYDYLLYDLLIITKQGKIISLIQPQGNSKPQVYPTRRAIIRLAKAYGASNGYEVESFKQFGAWWYDISFIDADTGEINRYPSKLVN